MVGFRIGRVIRQNVCQRLAPSSAAASYSSPRDQLQPGQQQQGHERGRLPDLGDDHRPDRHLRPDQEDDRRVDHAQPHQEVVGDAVAPVVDPGPHLRRDDRRQRPRHQHRGAHDAPPTEGPVDQQGDDHAEHQLGRHRDARHQPGHAQRVVPGVVGQDGDVVLQPDERARGVLEPQAEPEQAVPDRPRQRDDGDQEDGQDGGRGQQQPEPGVGALLRAPPSLAPSRPATANRPVSRACRCLPSTPPSPLRCLATPS